MARAHSVRPFIGSPGKHLPTIAATSNDASITARESHGRAAVRESDDRACAPALVVDFLSNPRNGRAGSGVTSSCGFPCSDARANYFFSGRVLLFALPTRG